MDLLRQLLPIVPREGSVPAALVVDALAEMDAAPNEGAAGRPHPDGWSCAALATRYQYSSSLMRERIGAGEFGALNVPGGPWKAGRGWMVPHHQVLARDRRVQGDEVPPLAPPPAPAVPPKKKTGPLSLSESRRLRETGARQ